jgi:hypothetical protein
MGVLAGAWGALLLGAVWSLAVVWHLFVVAGTTCHFFAVLWYAA